MLIPLRVSEKKCRFTAKKITFLEYLRVKRLELTKNITERKRLGSILFLPEGDDLNSLSHESVLRILNQGTLFHSVNTKNISVSDNGSALLYNEDDPIRDSLNDILYGKLFNIRCLSNHDVCILLSYLITVSEFSEINFSILRKSLEHINICFKTLLISEISHILYIITQIANIINSHKSLLDLCSCIVEKTVKLLFARGKFTNVDFVCSSNVCKILYSLSSSTFLSISSKYGIELSELIKVYEDYLGDDKGNVRDFNLICKCMIQLSSPNFQVLSRISDYYYNLLLTFNSSFDNDCLNRSDEYNLNIKSDVNSNTDRLYCLDKMDENIDLNNLFVLLDTNEYFGINHKRLLTEFNKYIITYITTFINNPTLYNKSAISTCDRRRKFFNLLKDNKYLRNNKLDLRKIYPEIIRLNENNNLIWDGQIIQKIYRYINSKRLFRKFIKVNFNHNLIDDKSILEINSDNLTDGGCTTASSNEIGDLDENELIEQFVGAVEYLPKVINFNNVWKVLKAINLLKRTDLVPMFCSYLQESSVIFECLEEPSHDLLGIFLSILGKNPCSGTLLELDNLIKIVEIFTDCDLSRDSIGIQMFTNMLNILFEVSRINEETYENMDQCGSLTYVKQLLMKYFREYSKRKHIEFDEIPKGESWYSRLRFIPRLDDCRGVEDMMVVLEDLGNLGGELREAVDLNKDVFKFVIYGALKGKMDKLSLESH